MAPYVMVNGERYVVLPLKDEDVVAGTLLREVYTRRAHRIVALDGDEVIVRNLRFTDKCEVMTHDELLQYCKRIVPVPDAQPIGN